MRRLASHNLSSGFSAVSLRPSVVPMGHVMNVDHFHMSVPTFPPHPHAGFSAVTWMAPWSPGGFINRDSLGDRSRIGPGSLHWTLAGSGMLHEEIPEVAGVDCEGMQIFVKLPEELELTPPRAFHVDADALPTLTQAGGSARVLVGTLGEVRATIPSHAQTMMAHVHVQGAMTLEVPEGVEAFLLGLRGAGRVGGVPGAAHEATALSAGPVRLEGDGFDVLLGWSAPMPGRPRFQGPFCMFGQARLDEAMGRYRAGGMGGLPPSPVAWAR
jgi:redox-sensitive bicupin YhaK (pirin superfamily)